eukprot:scaffold6914_cov155-Skeletonema_marinoi.AAC.1
MATSVSTMVEYTPTPETKTTCCYHVRTIEHCCRFGEFDDSLSTLIFIVEMQHYKPPPPVTLLA